MWYKLLWVGLLGLLSALLTFGLPPSPGESTDPSGYPEGGAQSDGGGETDPDGLGSGGGTDPNGLVSGGETDPNG